MKDQLKALLDEMDAIASECAEAELLVDEKTKAESIARYQAKEAEYDRLFAYAVACEKATFIGSIERWQYMRAIDGFLPIELASEWASRELGRKLDSLSDCTLAEAKMLHKKLVSL